MRSHDASRMLSPRTIIPASPGGRSATRVRIVTAPDGVGRGKRAVGRLTACAGRRAPPGRTVPDRMAVRGGQTMSRKDQIEALLHDDPDNSFLRYGLAMEHVSAGDDEAAVVTFRELMKRDGDYVPAYL